MRMHTLTRLVAPEVLIRVETRPTRKIWIMAEGGAWYQFVHTTPTPQFTGYKGGYAVYGSGVYVPLPPIPKTGPVTWPPAQPSASAVEGDDDSPWRRIPATPTEISNLTRWRGANQVQLIPLPTFGAFRDALHPPLQRLAYAQVSEQSQVLGAGAKMAAAGFLSGDVQYDAAPALLQGRQAVMKAPDADWYHDAALYRIENAQYGSRVFAVMSDASGQLHCWPTGAPIGPWSDPAYLGQSIKTNVAPEHAQTITPPYPEWVYRPATALRDQWNANAPQPSPDPRMSFQFHPFIPRTICVAVRRTPLADDRVFVTTANSGWEQSVSGTPYRIRLGDKLAAGRGIDSSGEEIAPQLDRPGWVEFDLSLEITGPEWGDFAFSAALREHHLATSEAYPIAAGYLAPVKGDWPSRGVAATAGNRIMVTVRLETDANHRRLIDAWAGYTVHPIRRAFAVFSVETGELFRVKLLEEDWAGRIAPSPDGTFDGSWSHHGTGMLRGKLFDLNLSQLTFGVLWEKLKITRGGVVDRRVPMEADVFEEPYPQADGYLLTQVQETGVRIVHRGLKGLERRYGAELNLFATADDPGDPAKFQALDVEEKRILWLSVMQGVSAVSRLSLGGAHLYATQILYDLWLLSTTTGTPIPPNVMDAALAAEGVGPILALYLGPQGLRTRADLARWWSGYTDDWFDEQVTPLLDRAWRANRRLLSHKPPDDFPPRGTPNSLGTALAMQHPPQWWAMQVWEVSRLPYFFPRLHDFPAGEQAYFIAWERLVSPVTLRLIADERGFWALFMPVIYQAEPIPVAREYALFGQPAMVSDDPSEMATELPPNSAKKQWRWDERMADFAPQPSASVMGQDILDMVAHEQGGETSHTALYNQAYRHEVQPSEMQGTPSVYIHPDDGRFVYRVSWKARQGDQPIQVHFDHPGSVSMLNLIELYAARANGAALFV